MSRTGGSCKNSMADGRAYTDYNPNCALNEHIKQKYGITSSTEFRLFLQRNACKIMGDQKKASEWTENAAGCSCSCNYAHAPHDPMHDRLYSRQVTPSEAYERNSKFNKPIGAMGTGTWTNYC